MGKLIKVTLLHSAINRQQAQKDTLLGLGLTRIGKTVFLPNTSTNRGMVDSVIHLVKVDVATEKQAAAKKPERQPSYRVIESK